MYIVIQENFGINATLGLIPVLISTGPMPNLV